MLIAKSEGRQRKLLVLGLQQHNIEGLLNDKPILKRLDGQTVGGEESVAIPGLEEWDVVILGPEDTIRFHTHYGGSVNDLLGR